jgi:hypothetical protein
VQLFAYWFLLFHYFLLLMLAAGKLLPFVEGDRSSSNRRRSVCWFNRWLVKRLDGETSGQ